MSKYRRNNVPEICYLRPGTPRLRDINKRNKSRRVHKKKNKIKEYPIIQKFIDEMNDFDKEVNKIFFYLKIKLGK